MKNALKGFLRWQVNTCIIFTIGTVVCTVVSRCYGQTAVEIPMLCSLMILSFAGSALQYLAFSKYIFKNMRYLFRLILFAVPFLAVLSACAVLFRWFPGDSFISWLIFAGIFLVIFIVMTLIFEISYAAAGKKYNGLLGEYKSRRNPEDQK